jgi:hypothetical protein
MSQDGETYVFKGGEGKSGSGMSQMADLGGARSRYIFYTTLDPLIDVDLKLRMKPPFYVHYIQKARVSTKSGDFTSKWGNGPSFLQIFGCGGLWKVKKATHLHTKKIKIDSFD